MRRDFIFLLIISVLIVVIWFSSGGILASGEESFSIFNKISIDSQTSLWQPQGTGYPMPVYMNRLIPVVFVKTLLLMNLQVVFIQAVFYFILIFLGMLGIYFLTKELFRGNLIAPFLVSVFYLLNLYSQLQVFGRFLYTGVAAWSLLPISLYFWIKWNNTFRFKWIFSFLLITVILSLAYLQPANIITLWSPLIIWTGYLVFRERKSRRKLFKILLSSFMGCGLWIIFNIWWLYPLLKIGNSAFGVVSSLKGNLDSLAGVSKYFNTIQIFLLRHNFLLGTESQFYDFYKSFWVYLISILVLGVVIWGLIKSRRTNFWFYLVIVLVVGWFVSKGSNFPFGLGFYSLVFSKFSFLTVFRNPYEKFGLVFLLPYSLFFGVGLSLVKNKFLVGLTILLANVILVLPMINGRIMKSKRVYVPLDYGKASEWVNKQNGDLRLFHEPATIGDGMTYAWGYNGVEPSEYLFGASSISKILRAKYFDDKYFKLVDDFDKDENLEKDLTEMEISYIVVHKDIDASVKWGDYKKSEEVIKNHPSIKLVANFGDLDIYKFENSSFNGLFELKGSLAGKISYQRINNRYYKVFVEDNQGSTNLIFKTTFNPLWEARIEGVQVPIHQVVYDYANEWDIEKTGSYTIDVKFVIWPWE